ncbi:hypothetical protein RSAG8_11286, partial [Rhizoctonia solani AG-8 WAC10335]
MNYKPHLDPQLQALASGILVSTVGECALFHYNGHGVPKPTRSGEIWVFNCTSMNSFSDHAYN